MTDPRLPLGIYRRTTAGILSQEVAYVCVRCNTDGHRPHTFATWLEASLHSIVCPYWGDAPQR